MKMKTLGLIAVGLLAGSMSAHAALIRVDFTVSGNWVNLPTGATPFGMPLSPNLAGTMVVDNSQTGKSALVDFSLTTGTKTWTESLFIGETDAFFDFDVSGNVSKFGLQSFADATGTMYIYSRNTFSVREDSTSEQTFCNECVAFTQQQVPAPAPATLALLGVGLAGLGFARRRKAQ